MSPDLLEPVLVGVASLLAALLSGLPRWIRDERASVVRDLEIFNALPDESSEKGRMLERIDDQLRALDARRDARRDPVGMAGAVFLIIASIVFGLAAVGAGGWWLITLPATAFICLLGIFGLAQSAPKRIRDARGNPLHEVASTAGPRTRV